MSPSPMLVSPRECLSEDSWRKLKELEWLGCHLSVDWSRGLTLDHYLGYRERFTANIFLGHYAWCDSAGDPDAAFLAVLDLFNTSELKTVAIEEFENECFENQLRRVPQITV
jgi:hypothetical protein